MKIKVGNTWFEPTTEAPLMVVLTAKEKQDIADMASDATMYAVFADDCGMSSNERLAWMTQPDPAMTRGANALMMGHPIPIHQADTIGVDEPCNRCAGTGRHNGIFGGRDHPLCARCGGTGRTRQTP